MFKYFYFPLAVVPVCLVLVSSLQAQQDFDGFWAKFASAVQRKDKRAVAALTRFPLADESENDEGPNPGYSRPKFFREYSYFFDRNIKECFRQPEFSLNNNDPTEKVLTCRRNDNTSFSFMFKRYRSGWKWINFNRD